MGKEETNTGLFKEKWADSETRLMSQVILEAMDCEPLVFENEEVQKNYDKIREVLLVSKKPKLPKLELQDRAALEYFPVILLERMVLNASKIVEADKNDGRSLRMYRFVAAKLSLAEDPRVIASMVEMRVNQLLDLFEDNNIEVEALAKVVRGVNGALFPVGLE